MHNHTTRGILPEGGGCPGCDIYWQEYRHKAAGSPHGHNAVKDRCKHGHPFTEDNTLIRPDGRRACRTCRRRWKREAKARARLSQRTTP